MAPEAEQEGGGQPPGRVSVELRDAERVVGEPIKCGGVAAALNVVHAGFVVVRQFGIDEGVLEAVPALVAAVTHARRGGWDAGQLLTTAYDLLADGQPADEPLRPDELATALIWRIVMLTDTTYDSYHPPGQADEPPIDVDDDLRDLPDADPHVDVDWLASLTEPEPDPGETETEPLNRKDPAQARSGPDARPAFETGQDPAAAVAVAPGARAEERDFVRDTLDQLCATAAVPRHRLVELNRLAEDFFTDHYRDAWAPTYLTGRLRTDLDGDTRLSVGYAPAGWTALTDHLRRHGATDDEIVGAGLGRIASTGRVIDQFRDRLVFAITAANADGDPEIHGWIGRRNPTHDGDGHSTQAGPKYLNTAETDLFHKGGVLYGLTEAAPALANDAAVVLVEGPMDAIAVTLAGRGDFVGVAPLGTAFTDAQADQLRPHVGHRAFWQLTARTANPQHLVITDGKDPAELLNTAGPDALHAALSSTTDLADAVIAARLSEYTDRLGTVEGRVFATRRAAQVIAALPDGWIGHIDRLVDQTGISKPIAMSEVLHAVEAWTGDPRGLAKKHLAERAPILPTPASATDPTAAARPPAPTPPTQRWAPLAESVHTGLSSDPY